MARRSTAALTALAVKNAKSGRHADGGGLYLLVKKSGGRSWVYRFMRGGRSRDVGLGPASGSGAVSLSDARNAAARLRVQIADGDDPITDRRRQKAEEAKKFAESVTFRAAAESYIETNEHSWRNDKHRQQWRNTLATYAYPIIGDVLVGDVSTAHVVKILSPIWKEKPETASRLRGRIEAVLDAAKVQEFRSGENSARWRGHLEHLLPVRTRLKRGHHRAMPFEKVPEFMARLRLRDSLAARALEFTILTAARTGETLGATAAEIDLEKRVWTVPAVRMKAGREHRVPLPPRVLALATELRAGAGMYVFSRPNGGPLSQMAMTMLLRRMRADCTVHGFRSSFRDWAAENTDYAHEVAEMALAHTVASKVERAYRRGDLFEKRRAILADWEAFCAGSA